MGLLLVKLLIGTFKYHYMHLTDSQKNHCSKINLSE